MRFCRWYQCTPWLRTKVLSFPRAIPPKLDLSGYWKGIGVQYRCFLVLKLNFPFFPGMGMGKFDTSSPMSGSE